MKKEFVIAIICTLFLGSFVLPYDARASVSKDQAFRLGYDEGYRDGAREGQNDYRSGRGYDLRSDRYRKADDGWRNSIGHRGDYQKGYREGYESGYRSAYQGGMAEAIRAGSPTAIRTIPGTPIIREVILRTPGTTSPLTWALTVDTATAMKKGSKITGRTAIPMSTAMATTGMPMKAIVRAMATSVTMNPVIAVDSNKGTATDSMVAAAVSQSPRSDVLTGFVRATPAGVRAARSRPSGGYDLDFEV